MREDRIVTGTRSRGHTPPASDDQDDLDTEAAASGVNSQGLSGEGGVPVTEFAYGAALTIQQALAAVMADVGAIGKERRIEQGPAKYAYRGIEDMLSKIQPAFVRHGVVCYPQVITADYRDGTTRNGGSTREATMHVRFVFVGPNGDSIEVVTVGEAVDTSDKCSNKAMTAAYKYALLLTLAIPTELDDQDSEAHQRGPSQAQLEAEEREHRAWLTEAKSRVLRQVKALGGDKDAAVKWWTDHTPSTDDELEALLDRIEQAGDA